MLQSAETTANLAITPRRMINSIMNFGPVINEKFKIEKFSFRSLFSSLSVYMRLIMGTASYFAEDYRRPNSAVIDVILI
jgi:hypothetical protein